MDIITSGKKGNVIISDEVISSIAMNAAKDVEGVSSFSNRPADVVNTIKQGSLKVTKSVRVNQNGDDVTVNMYINLAPNQVVAPVAQAVQQSVKEAVQNMTGKLVKKVNVIITGIDVEKSEDAAAPTEIKE